MTEKYQTAFLLLTIGMITVFVILFLVVVISKLMIRIINKFFSDFDENDKPLFEKSDRLITSQQLTAIIAVVDILSKGTGQVDTIKKIRK